MKMNLVRAVLVASLSLFFVGAAFTPTPAVAAESAKPKLSKAASKPLVEAQKASQAKDWPTMIAKAKEVLAMSDINDYDKYIANYFLGLAYYNTGDKASAAPAFYEAATSTGASPEEHANALKIAIELENEMKDYAKVIALGQSAAQIGNVDSTVAAVVAIAYYNTADYPNAMAYAQKSIDADTAAGKLPDRGVYQVVLMVQNRQKNVPAELKTLETMSSNYGNSEDWTNLIDVSIGSLPKSSSKDIAILYLFRLGLTAKVQMPDDDYVMMAGIALAPALHYPGDAQQALQEGFNSGVLSQAKGGALLNKANAAAKSDQASLPVVDAAAAKNPSAVGDVSVAEDYYGYGRYADAARVAQRAISKGGPKATEAQLLLGVTQAKQGDEAAATQSLALVRGDAALERAAQLWTRYVTLKYGRTPAAAQPTAQ